MSFLPENNVGAYRVNQCISISSVLCSRCFVCATQFQSGHDCTTFWLRGSRFQQQTIKSRRKGDKKGQRGISVLRNMAQV